jgi:hypothetical protein
MKYTVVWKPDAEAELVWMWTHANDRNAVTAAANRIDQLLGSNPDQQGESRTEATRVFFVDPLGVFYHVDTQDLLVSVL